MHAEPLWSFDLSLLRNSKVFKTFFSVSCIGEMVPDCFPASSRKVLIKSSSAPDSEEKSWSKKLESLRKLGKYGSFLKVKPLLSRDFHAQISLRVDCQIHSHSQAWDEISRHAHLRTKPSAVVCMSNCQSWGSWFKSRPPQKRFCYFCSSSSAVNEQIRGVLTVLDGRKDGEGKRWWSHSSADAVKIEGAYILQLFDWFLTHL